MSQPPQSAWKRVGVVYRVFGPYLRPYSRSIILAYLAMAATVAFSLLRPWPLKLILDGVILNKRRITEMVPFAPAWVEQLAPEILLTILAAALVLAVLLESTAGYLQKLLYARVGHGATTDVLEDVYAHVQRLPRSSGTTRTGDTIVRLTSDMKTMRDLLVEHVQKLCGYALSFLGVLAVAAWMDWKLTLLGLSVVPFIYLASVRMSARIRHAARRKRKREGAVASAVQETIHSLLVIQAFTQEQEERRRFQQQTRQSLEASIESSRLGGAFNRSVTVLNTLGTALAVWFGARQALAGAMSPGDLVVFAAYMTELYKPVQNFSELSVQFLESLVSGERVLEVLETAPRVHDLPGAMAARTFQGAVEFSDVVFGYRPDEPVLRDMSFRISPGQKVALVGRSGSGKSTVLQLLLRFYDPWRGRISIDGEDIRRLKIRSLRGQISVVLQESVLFRRTVRENIAYGKPGATRGEIVAAAQSAQAHEFIEALPDGYDTMLDESGWNLSGGQRQRIALARAFLRNSPILVMDEPTSGLDLRTEAQLNETLRELARGRTTIVIAHRLSTVEDADLILVLDEGHVAQQGRHQELIAQPGTYRALYEAQATTAANG